MFEKSIEELDEMVKFSLKDISFPSDEKQSYIIALEEILKNESKINIITYVTLLVSNIKILDISDYEKTTHLSDLARFLYIEINAGKETVKETIQIPNRMITNDDVNKIRKILNSNIKTNTHFVIDENSNIYKIDDKEPGMKIYQTLASTFSLQVTIYIKKELSHTQKDSKFYTLSKYVLNEAIKTASLSELYGIAGYTFNYTNDFKFTVELYQKAIDWCYKINNTSRLHLLGQNMLLCDTEYFDHWGKNIMKEAKKLSDEQKFNNIRN